MKEHYTDSGMENAHCPVFKATRLERVAPRTFLLLLKEGINDPVLFNCTLCGACTQDTVTGIDIQKELKQARIRIVNEGKEIPEFKEYALAWKKTGNIYGVEE